MIDHARGNLGRAVLRRQLVAIAAGRGERLNFDLDANTFDPTLVLRQVVARLRIDSIELRRLVAAFHQSGSLNQVVRGLAAGNTERRIRSCRTVGALRLDGALPSVTPLLRAKDQRVSASAARALGRIGGVRSADALLSAIQRRGPRRTFITALAQAAPDLFLESEVSSRQNRGTLGAIAIATGLRRRRTAIGPLSSLLETGTRRQRVICCRALGWSRARAAISSVIRALYDPDWSVRISAIKSLIALQAASPPDQLAILVQLERLIDDPDLRVRRVARRAVRRIRNVLLAGAGRWPWR